MLFKKTIIMVSANGGAEKAVLNIQNQGSLTSGKLKIYNTRLEGGIYVLAFYDNNKVTKCALTQKLDEWTFSTEEKVDLDKSFCALVNIKNATAFPIVVGSANSQAVSKQSQALSRCVNELEEKTELKAEEVKQILDDNQIDFDEEEKEVIEQAISQHLGCEAHHCADCKYREAFYQEIDEEEAQTPSYYSQVSDQLKELFDTCEKESALEEIIPNSKWARVDTLGDGNYWVIGLIYQNSELKFVCFGVPGTYSSSSPQELEGICRFVPLDDTRPYEEGYWITYQDSQTGENVDVDIV